MSSLKNYCPKHYYHLKTYGRILERTRFDKNRIIYCKEYCLMGIYGNKNNLIVYTKIDIKDVKRVIKYKWSLQNKKYIVTRLKGSENVFIRLHRLIINCPKNKYTDHVSGDTLDNRKTNLRACTMSQNLANQSGHKRKVPKKSNYKGVFFDKNYKSSKGWYAKISCKNKTYGLGHFNSEFNAARAYDKKAIELFGGFARVNFP